MALLSLSNLRRIKMRFYHFRQNLRIAFLTVLHPIVEISGGRLRAGRHISPRVRHYLYSGEYENEELAILVAKLEPNDVIMELGGGLGFVSAFCAKRIGSDRVFTYEANPASSHTFGRLVR